MKKLISSVLFLAFIGLTAALDQGTVAAQQKRASSHDTIYTVVDKTNRVMVVYGRPYTKDAKSGQNRKIWGTLVPYDKVWRLGADEATILVSQQPIKMGELTVPAGAHTLFLLPAENGPTKLIVNKQLAQWGLQYDEKQDLGRVDMKKDTLPAPVEQFTMGIDRNMAGGGTLKLMWDTLQFSVPFTTQK